MPQSRYHESIFETAAWVACALSAILALLAFASALPASDSFSFAILGDRTGDAQPGVYEQVWKEVDAERPDFVLSVGDTIEGLHDRTADAEWRAWQTLTARYRRYPLFLAPGNHDIWSDASAQLFRRYAAHPPHYSFDYGPAHFTMLDNSRCDQLSPDELNFAEADLRQHAGQPLKFILSHRPSWLLSVLLGSPRFALHQLARQYGVQYIVAGHLHEMLHADLDGVTYVSVASSGGHLRATHQYEDGWFFGHTLVQVRGGQVHFRVEELAAPYGRGRVTTLQDWGKAGLIGPAQ